MMLEKKKYPLLIKHGWIEHIPLDDVPIQKQVYRKILGIPSWSGTNPVEFGQQMYQYISFSCGFHKMGIYHDISCKSGHIKPDESIG